MQFQIPRHSDAFILEKLTAICREKCARSWSIQCEFIPVGVDSSRIGGVIRRPQIVETKDAPVPKPWEREPLIATAAASGAAMISKFQVAVDDVAFFLITRDLAEATDKGGALWGDNERDTGVLARRADFAGAAAHALGASGREAAPTVLMGESLARRVEARDIGLARLEELLSGFTGQLAEFRLEAEKRVKEGEDAARKLIADERGKLSTEFDAKAKELAGREAALAERLKKVDDRDEKHARRDLRNSIIKLLGDRSEKFELTKGTGRLRLRVGFVLGAGGVVFAALLGQSIWLSLGLVERASGWNVALTYLLIRQVVYAGGLLGIIWYAINWTNDWFKQHAREEFKGKNMALDIERASWVVETALEWQKQAGKPLPAVLIDRITTGLFSQPEEGRRKNDTDLASKLIGATSKLSVGLGDHGHLEIDRKGAEKFDSETE